MPPLERLGPDDRENIQDRWKPAIQLDKEQAVAVPLPPTYYIYLLLILLSYAVLTHVVKTWCTRRFGLS